MKNIKIIRNSLIINETIFNCIDKHINELNKVATTIDMSDRNELTFRRKSNTNILQLFRNLQSTYFSNHYTEEMYTKFTLLVINNVVKSIISNEYVVPKQLHIVFKSHATSSKYDIHRYEKNILYAATNFKFDFIRFLKYEYKTAIDAGFKPSR